MYPQVFEIELDQESRRFVAGQLITGRVILILLREKAVKGISIRLLGRGYVCWEAGRSGLKYSHNIHNKSEDYVDIRTKLLHRDDGREQIIEPGKHQYNFSIQLPPNLPSSIETPHGHIRYTLEASIQRSWKDDYISNVPILFVKALVDLNIEPTAGEPVKIFKERQIGLMMCQTGPIGVNFLLSRAGFVPGESLQFSLEIRNCASVKISAVIITLRNHVTFKVGQERKSQAEKILQMVGPSVELKGSLLWQNHFAIPDLPPNPLEGCNIMELKYYLELKLVLERWTDLKICTPLIIGSIPYYSSYTQETKCPVKFPPVPAELVEQEPENLTKIPLPLSSQSQLQSQSRPRSQNHIHDYMNHTTDIHSHSPPPPSHLPAPLQPQLQPQPQPMTNHNHNYVQPSQLQLQPQPLPPPPPPPPSCLGWGSSACLAEIEKITSRPVPTVPSFLLSASENLYAMSMGSCDRISTNYEILDDRHILFEDEDAFVEMCSAKLQNMFLDRGGGTGTGTAGAGGGDNAE